MPTKPRFLGGFPPKPRPVLRNRQGIPRLSQVSSRACEGKTRDVHGFTACDSAEWLAHKGTVGRVLFGDLHILDESMNPAPTGRVGTVWFRLGSSFEYFNDRA